MSNSAVHGLYVAGEGPYQVSKSHISANRKSIIDRATAAAGSSESRQGREARGQNREPRTTRSLSDKKWGVEESLVSPRYLQLTPSGSFIETNAWE